MHSDTVAPPIYLESGCDIRTVQELSAQADVSTTMIHTHVLNRGGKGVRSPLDLWEPGAGFCRQRPSPGTISNCRYCGTPIFLAFLRCWAHRGRLVLRAPMDRFEFR